MERAPGRPVHVLRLQLQPVLSVRTLRSGSLLRLHHSRRLAEMQVHTGPGHSHLGGPDRRQQSGSRDSPLESSQGQGGQDELVVPSTASDKGPISLEREASDQVASRTTWPSCEGQFPTGSVVFPTDVDSTVVGSPKGDAVHEQADSRPGQASTASPETRHPILLGPSEPSTGEQDTSCLVSCSLPAKTRRHAS